MFTVPEDIGERVQDGPRHHFRRPAELGVRGHRHPRPDDEGVLDRRVNDTVLGQDRVRDLDHAVVAVVIGRHEDRIDGTTDSGAPDSPAIVQQTVDR